jgi:hypothetical protein
MRKSHGGVGVWNIFYFLLLITMGLQTGSGGLLYQGVQYLCLSVLEYTKVDIFCTYL